MSTENSTPVDNSHDTPTTVTDENHMDENDNDVKYDDMQQELANARLKEEEEERDRIKRQEEKQAKRIARIARLKEKDPPNSIAWCIGDSPAFMMILQICVLSVCALSLYCSYLQFEADDYTNNEECFGPYYFEKDGVSHRCGWPQTNFIIRLTAPGVGFLSSFILFIITVTSGRKLHKSIDAYNKLHFPNADDKGVEYYEIYNTCYFKFLRRIISACAYLQLVSFGLDLARYETGQKYAKSKEPVAYPSASDLKYNFQAPLMMGLAVAFVLRFSHDAIWVALKKKAYRCQIAVNTETTYTTTTHEKADTVVAYIDPNASTVDGNERYARQALSVRSGMSGNGMHLPSTSQYAPSASGHGVEYHQYTPSSGHPDHAHAPTVIYVNKTPTTA